MHGSPCFSLGFSPGLFVNKCEGISTNYTFFVLVNFTLESLVAALSTCLPPTCCIWTQLRLSGDQQPFLPFCPFCCRLLLSWAGLELLGSSTIQEDQSSVENEEMCPIICLLTSFYIFCFLSFMSMSRGF